MSQVAACVQALGAAFAETDVKVSEMEARLMGVINRLSEEVRECKQCIQEQNTVIESLKASNSVTQQQQQQQQQQPPQQQQQPLPVAPVPVVQQAPRAFDTTETETPLFFKADVPAAVVLTEIDVNRRIQVKETGDVLLCMKRDEHKFGWKKLKDDQLTAKEISYKGSLSIQTPAAFPPPPVPVVPQVGGENAFGAPAIPSTSLFPPAEASPFPPPEEAPFTRSVSFPGPNQNPSDLSSRSASFTLGQPVQASNTAPFDQWTTAPPSQEGWSTSGPTDWNLQSS
eukprot:TRINITY_DN3322_c0_g1_i1.p1 TRINITY_DN3322_c0_g1~~TRINITY_DN3322_c0_g1_i1.p1  ORF type:complete len:284 (+),score=73.90 TRINITY_DN3322_c0_g1_i1:89-940(+)